MKRYIASISLILLALLALSCNKEKETGTGKTAVLGVSVKKTTDVIVVPQRQTRNFDVVVTSSPGPDDHLEVSVAVDPSLVEVYNAKNGTNYQMLPSTAYELRTARLIIPRYNHKSTAVKLSLKGRGCEQDQTYLLPLVVGKVVGTAANEAPENRAAYVLFQMSAAELRGDGIQSSPFLINNAEDFTKMGNLLISDEPTYFKLTADINMSRVDWESVDCIDDDDPNDIIVKKAYLDGDHKTISNFSYRGGIFSRLVGGVENLNIENATVRGGTVNGAGILADCAGLAEEPDAILVNNVTVAGSTVSARGDFANKRIGGLIGRLKGGIIQNAEVSCEVESDADQVGGLIGRMEAGQLIDCSASGTVTSHSYMIGGLVGNMLGGSVSGCHATGDVTGENGNYTRGGGLVGQVDGDVLIEKCYATGNVTGTGHFGGGLVGVVATEGVSITIDRCYATGNVSLPNVYIPDPSRPDAKANWAHAGGLLGSISSKNVTAVISNCYATGAIACVRYSGGFVGSVYGAAGTRLTITDSYSSCDLSGIPGGEGGNRLGIVLGTNTVDEFGSSLTSITCTGFVKKGKEKWQRK